MRTHGHPRLVAAEALETPVVLTAATVEEHQRIARAQSQHLADMSDGATAQHAERVGGERLGDVDAHRSHREGLRRARV